jgi:hypothetical protein
VIVNRGEAIKAVKAYSVIAKTRSGGAVAHVIHSWPDRAALELSQGIAHRSPLSDGDGVSSLASVGVLSARLLFPDLAGLALDRYGASETDRRSAPVLAEDPTETSLG